ncbi:hypothetical protein U1Q18_052474 [Sarracenia purpurea var. burkii]
MAEVTEAREGGGNTSGQGWWHGRRIAAMVILVMTVCGGADSWRRWCKLKAAQEMVQIEGSARKTNGCWLLVDGAAVRYWSAMGVVVTMVCGGSRRWWWLV